MNIVSQIILYKSLKSGKSTELILRKYEDGSISSQVCGRPQIQVCGVSWQGLISKKLRDGYRLTEEPIHSDMVAPLLMYSNNLRDKSTLLSRLDPGYWVGQPKLNGVRCSALWMDGSVKLFTKKRKEIVGLNQLKNSLKPILEKSSIIMDGEIYCHGMRLQKISGLVRRSVNIKPEEESKLGFHIFDVVNTELPFKDRYNLIPSPDVLPDGIFKVPCFPLNSAEHRDAMLAELESKGFEGMMLRRLTGMYTCGFRSSDLLKYKSFMDKEFEIVGYRAGTGKDSNIPIFACQTVDGERFDVKMEGTYEDNEGLLRIADSQVGKYLTVRFFDYTERGVPEFPVGVAIRDYE